MTKEETLEFAKQLVYHLEYPFPNIRSVHKPRIDKNNLEEYIELYYKHKSKPYIKKLNNLLDNFEKILGHDFFNREWEFKRWTGYEKELEAWIKVLESEKKKK